MSDTGFRKEKLAFEECSERALSVQLLDRKH